MSDHRWQGYSHAELFEMLHQGPGPHASSSSAQRWADLRRALEEIDGGIGAALNAARADWHGRASDSAQQGLRPLGEWARQAQEAADRMRACSEQQADFIAKARAEMPPPRPCVAEEPNALGSMLVHLFGGQTDYEIQEQRQDAAEQRAFDVMRAYQESSEANTTSLAAFSAPPQVVVDTPAQQSPGGRELSIHWGQVNTGGRTTGSPASAKNSGSTRATRSIPMSRSGGSDSTTGARAGASTSRHRSRLSDEERQPPPAVTETVGDENGLFDEHRTLARPVIGGEPG